VNVLAVTNMYPTPQAPSSGIFVEQQIAGLRRIGLDVRLVFVPRLERGMRAYAGLGTRIRSQVGQYRPDLVHVMYGGVMADQVTRHVRTVPVVVTFHGSDLLGEGGAGPLRRMIAQYGVRASRKAARRASGIIVVSKILEDALPDAGHRARTRIIPCGIDLERFSPLDRLQCCTRLGWSPDAFNVLFPSSAANPVKRAHLAGCAIELLRRSGLDVRLHYLTGVTNDQVPTWLNAADVVLLTSAHEGSPTVVKEALACNRPIVSVDVGDVGERIDAVNGCHLSPAEPSALADALRMVRESRQPIAGRRVAESLSIERIADRLRGFYEEVLGAEVRVAPRREPTRVAGSVS